MAKSITYECLVHSQRPESEAPKFCLFSAEVGEILKWAEIKRLADEPGAPQRSIRKAKVLAVQNYFRTDAQNTIPTGIIVSLKLPRGALKPVRVANVDSGSFQLLTISYDDNKKPGFIVDGQHRVLGMNEFDPNLRVNVVGLLNADDMEIAFQFLVINNKATKVSTDHIRALALDYKRDELDGRLRNVRLNLDQRIGTLGFADHDEASPFRGLVDWPSNRSPRKVVKPAAIEAAIADIQRRKVREFNDEDTVLTYFFTVWDAVRTSWPNAWEPKTRSRLLSKVGIVCMSGYITDALVSAYDWGDLDISDPDAVRVRVKQLLVNQEEQFWVVGWTSTSLDTRAGRDIVLESLSLVARNKRADLPWFEGIDLVDVNQLDEFAEPA